VTLPSRPDKSWKDRGLYRYGMSVLTSSLSGLGFWLQPRTLVLVSPAASRKSAEEDPWNEPVRTRSFAIGRRLPRVAPPEITSFPLEMRVRRGSQDRLSGCVLEEYLRFPSELITDHQMSLIAVNGPWHLQRVHPHLCFINLFS
jgi:hypothetical protein